MKRPATLERSSIIRRRAASLAETSPYRRASAPSIEELAVVEFGPYLVYEKLGDGGMAHVHRAERVGTTGFRKEIALKRLNTEASEDPGLVAAFVHEAQLAAKLQHPNIAQAYELGKIDNTYYIAMELVPGPTLLQVLTQSRKGAGAVPIPIAVELLIQIADALEHVHELRDDGGKSLQMIHRDVSPANIIISRSGAAKLIDFGIAKVRSGRAATEAGYIKGKTGYIAPEYTYGQLDHRADLFALGVVAHELLTGRRLFSADNELATLQNIRKMPVPPPSRHRNGISAELDAIVLKALERDPEQRWQTAGELRAALAGEAKRLGVVVCGPQIRDWVEWAFQQLPRRESSVERAISGLEASKSVVIELDLDARLTIPVRFVEAETVELPTVVVSEPTPRMARALTPKPRVPTAVAAPPPKKKQRRVRVRGRGRGRAPSWRAPTRWAQPQQGPSLAPFVIALTLVAFLVLAADQGLFAFLY